uniref:DUF2063 domain-containing protein n=1 Tax=uncultured Thiotrichaceae bacterium TaxID=298394 RepID=A0A6S6UML2_9GAMM|nr:MAG: DUF2063 domain-containing protein [uncultured Thiotrichaceae bacterium]
MSAELSESIAKPSLVNLQQNFLAYLRDPPAHQSMTSFVSGTESVSAELRLRIYAHAYEARLTEALQDNFPALHTLLGDDDFYELAAQYISTYPSKSFSLRYFGDRLCQWLRERLPYAKQSVLAEMALFEWSVWTAFDAPDIDPATIEDLQAVPPHQWGELTFDLHPSSQVVSLEWNVPVLWQAITDEADPIAPEQQEYPHSWLVWRQGLGTYFRALEVDEAWALSKVEQGESFAYLCEGVCEWVDTEHAATRVVGFLQVWLSDGVICMR